MTEADAEVRRQQRQRSLNLPTYTCALCGLTSHNLFDARHSYCSCCGSADLPKSCSHRTSDSNRS